MKIATPLVRTESRWSIGRIWAGLRWRARPFMDRVEKLFEWYGPERLVLEQRFRRIHGRRLNWRNPTMFQEKIYWIMRYVRSPIMTQLADKAAVRDFVAQRIGAQHLNARYGIWRSAGDVDFGALPDTFVLKATHGSRMVLICRDRTTFDERAARLTMARWLKTNYSRRTREWVYRDIPPRIIAEALLADGTGDLTDYKFHCFDGQPRLIEVLVERFTGHGLRRELFTPEWERITTYRLIYYPPADRDIPPPSNLAEMLECARRLSAGFPFVRVDLYCVNGRTVFGEMTWYPEGGWGRFMPIDAELRLGAELRLPRGKAHWPRLR
jgi:hypothetical protein